ncbi:TIGR03943 family putative permease subunit [Paenibacillus radicis (ex Xue et al. 2023)]|uniref:TIGR03943 family protein n=1 Tax=Paenibacillus radicis (ex Xue et al. 2023) TaxID=2972489 RepID=A0ABT1YI29_9BACL|nr:TIGR03943 family protein [Paenibacillus radicis (ex Xue et al. 2023)]MCR8632839.1 TIGR03943 family protein [Paenibacillus radicis (ex Xue et al. 2023)]
MSPRIYSLHHFIKASILFGFAMYIVHLVRTDNILFYIAPRMVDYVKWSAVAFYAIAVYQVYQAIRAFFGSAAACDCDHDHTPSSSLLKNTVIYGLFFFPLLLGFLLPDTSMGSSLAAKKGMNLSSSSNVKKEASSTAPSAPVPNPAAPSSGGAASSNGSGTTGSAAAPGAAVTPGDSAGKTAPSSSGNQDAMFPSDRFTEHYAKYAKELYKSGVIPVKENMYIETLTTLDLYLDQFIGKKLELTGFVYRQEDMKDNQFVVGRFSIQCCSADASPFGVLVEYDRAKNFADDSWVTVTGTIQKTKFNDMDIMLLKVEKVAKAEPAKTQYVYPNIDFGT